MSSSQKSKSASDNADNGGSVVDRMGTIIRNAHRAIEVLKEENSALKIANDKLQVMVDDLMSQLQSRPAPSQRSSLPVKNSISLLGLNNPYQQPPAAVPLLPASSLSKGLMPKSDQAVHTSIGTPAIMTDDNTSKELFKSSVASSISSIQNIGSSDSRVISASVKLETGNSIIMPGSVGTTIGQQKKVVQSKSGKESSGSHAISPKKAVPVVATASVMKRMIDTASDNVLSSVKPVVAATATLAVGKEFGQAKYKAILRSGDVSIYLSGVTVDNVHSAAKKMRAISPDDMMRGLLGVIAIHLRGDLLHEWRRLPLIASSLFPSKGMQEGASSSLSSSSSSVASVQLIPLTMIERLDALVSLLVSLTTRTGWGVDALSRLIGGLSNHILCSIRDQLCSSPFYAAVMGTCSDCEERIDKKSIYLGEDRCDDSGHDVIVPGDAPNAPTVPNDAPNAPTDDAMVQESSCEEDNDSVGTHLSYSSADDDSVADGEGEAIFVRSDDDDDDDAIDDDDDDDSEDDNDDSNDVAAAPEHELASDVPSVRRSELAALLDLGSSDDSEDDASEPPTAVTTASACPHRDITSRSPSDDDRGSSSQVIDLNLSSTHNTATAADAPSSTCSTTLLLLQSSSSSQLDRHWIKAFSTASTLYIVLSLLLRLSHPRQVAMLLRQLTLLTSGNCSYGAMIGVVAVLGSSRFSTSSSAAASTDSTTNNNDEVRAALFQLLINCYVDLIDRNSRGDESSLQNSSEHNLSYIVGLLLKSKYMFKVTDIVDQLIDQQSKGSTTSAGAAAAAMVERVLRHRINPVSCIDRHEEVLYMSLETYRRVGFWASIEKLSLVSIPLGDATANGCIFTMLGLSNITAFTSIFRQLLMNWTNEESAVRGRGTSHNSLKSFLSEPYGSMSDRQLNVHRKCIALEVPVNSIRTEEMLMDEFSVYWKETLATLSSGPIDRHINFIAHLTRGIAVVNDILQSILSTEYSTTDFGWCSGVQGLGSRLELKANDKTAHIQLQLRNLLSSSSISINRQSSTRSAAIPPTIMCYPYSSISPLKTIESVELLDYCWSEVFQCSSSSDGGGGTIHDTVGRTASIMSIEEVNKDDMLSKLHKSCTELLFVIALSFVEHFLYLFLSSLRGLLRTLRSHVSSLLTIPNADDGIKHRLIEGYLLLIDEICSVIADIPLPWSSICNVRIQYDIFHAATSIMEVVQAATDQTGYMLSRSFTHFPHGQWLMDLRAQLPAYVINLDRRVDRWRHSLFKHSKEGFSLIRVSAVDGAAVVDRAVYHDSSGRGRMDDDDADATVNLIPECDVSRTWDSTLNSQFDGNCPANHRVVSTSSERACAASHLRVWRMIAGIITNNKHKLIRQQLSDKGIIQDDLHDLTKWLSSLRSMLPDYDYSYIVENMLMLNNNKPDKKNASKAKSTFTAHSINNNNNKQSSSRKESESGSEYYLIMEDDLAASPEYSGKLQSLIHRLMKKLPDDVDILYLKGIVPKSSQYLKASVLNKLFMEVNYVWTLKAYVLRESAVDTLLANLPITGPVGNFVAQLIYSRQLKACIFRNHIFSKKTKFQSDMRHSGTVRSVSSVRGIIADRSKRFEKMKSNNSGGGSSKGKKRKRSITFAPDVK